MFSRIVRTTWVQVRSLQTSSVHCAKRLPKGGYVLNQQIDALLQEDETEEYLDEIGKAFERKHHHQKQEPKKSTKQLEKEKIKRRIQKTKVKAIYAPKEPSLLTWAAKMQIVHLHKTDPMYWTHEMLANSFPVSVQQVKDIINKRAIPTHQGVIVKHDQKVQETWLRLQEVCLRVENGEESELDTQDRWLAEFGKRVLHLLPAAAGDVTRSVPPDKLAFRTQEQLAEENKPKTTPYFSEIWTSYKGDIEKLESQSKSEDKPIGFDVGSVKSLLENIAKLGNASPESFKRNDLVREIESGSMSDEAVSKSNYHSDDVTKYESDGYSYGYILDDTQVGSHEYPQHRDRSSTKSQRNMKRDGFTGDYKNNADDHLEDVNDTQVDSQEYPQHRDRSSTKSQQRNMKRDGFTGDYKNNADNHLEDVNDTQVDSPGYPQHRDRSSTKSQQRNMKRGGFTGDYKNNADNHLEDVNDTQVDSREYPQHRDRSSTKSRRNMKKEWHNNKDHFVTSFNHRFNIPHKNEPKPSFKNEPKQSYKIEPKQSYKIEPKPSFKNEPKPSYKIEPKQSYKNEPKPSFKNEPKPSYRDKFTYHQNLLHERQNQWGNRRDQFNDNAQKNFKTKGKAKGKKDQGEKSEYGVSLLFKK